MIEPFPIVIFRMSTTPTRTGALGQLAANQQMVQQQLHQQVDQHQENGYQQQPAPSQAQQHSPQPQQAQQQHQQFNQPTASNPVQQPSSADQQSGATTPTATNPLTINPQSDQLDQSSQPSPTGGMGAVVMQQQKVQFSGHTLDKATKAKVHLENYYSNLIAAHNERKNRHEKLEESLREEGLSEEQVRYYISIRTCQFFIISTFLCHENNIETRKALGARHERNGISSPQAVAAWRRRF